MYYQSRGVLEKLRSDCRFIVERCRNQRVTLLLEKQHLRASALLRDHEPKLRQARRRRQQVERVVRRLLDTVPEKLN